MGSDNQTATTWPQGQMEAIRTSSVHHPAHYNQGEMETIEAIEGQGWGPGFCCGSIVKYLARYGSKDGSKDLQKAEWFVRRLLRKQLVMDGGETDARNTMLLLAIEIACEELPGVRADLTHFLAARNQAPAAGGSGSTPVD